MRLEPVGPLFSGPHRAIYLSNSLLHPVTVRFHVILYFKPQASPSISSSFLVLRNLCLFTHKASCDLAILSSGRLDVQPVVAKARATKASTSITTTTVSTTMAP